MFPLVVARRTIVPSISSLSNAPDRFTVVAAPPGLAKVLPSGAAGSRWNIRRDSSGSTRVRGALVRLGRLVINSSDRAWMGGAAARGAVRARPILIGQAIVRTLPV